MKQINDTLVVGTIIVPRQECFVLEKDKRKRKNVKEKIDAGVSFFATSPQMAKKKIFLFQIQI